MAKAKMTVAGTDGDAHPRCPHCDASMWDAPTTLSKIMIGWPHGGFVHVDADGYAHPGDYLEIDCPECRKPSAVAFSPGGWAKLIAARTSKDVEYLHGPEDALASFFRKALSAQVAAHVG